VKENLLAAVTAHDSSLLDKVTAKLLKFFANGMFSPQIDLPNNNEVGYSRNPPALLCFYYSASILTALINIQVSKHHKGKPGESAHKTFFSEIDFASSTQLKPVNIRKNFR